MRIKATIELRKFQVPLQRRLELGSVESTTPDSEPSVGFLDQQLIEGAREGEPCVFDERGETAGCVTLFEIEKQQLPPDSSPTRQRSAERSGRLSTAQSMLDC